MYFLDLYNTVTRLSKRVIDERARGLLLCCRLKRACLIASDRAYAKGLRDGRKQ